MKKLWKVSFAALLILPSLSHAFDDVASGNKHYEAIEYLESEGIVEGYGDGTYKPDQPISRAEFLKIVFESRDLLKTNGSYCFTDVKEAWYSDYICSAKNLGIVQGYGDGSFQPEQNITLAEALKITLEAYGLSLASSTPWYQTYLDYAYENALLHQIDSQYFEDLSRGEMAQVIYNLDHPEEPTVLVPHSESGIFDLTDYEEPEKVWLGTGDTLLLDNGLTLEVIHSIPDSTRLAFYYDGIERLYDPAPFVTLRRDGGYNPPFHSRFNNYLYLGAYDEDTQQSEIEIYSDPKDLYQRCLRDSLYEDSFCLTEIGRYESVHESYKKLSEGRFNVVYPTEIEEAAQQTMEYLPSCYNSIKDIFGTDQAIDEFTVFFYYPEDAETFSAHAVSDAIIVPFYDYHMDQLAWEQPSKVCGVDFFPMGHEMTHVFDYGSQNTPVLREGFANYISRRVSYFESELVCSEEGYYKYYLESDYGSMTPYPESSNDDSYNVGECYFQRLENTYGIALVNELIEVLGSTRNIESSGEFVYAGNVNFFRDVIEPIFGESAVKMAEEMNIDVSCDYSVPFSGYLCASD